MIKRLPIEHGREVIFHFTIKLMDDSVADSTEMAGKPAKCRIGDGNLTVNFEACMIGLKAGDQREFVLPPEDAFGQPNRDNIYQVAATKFVGDKAEVGSIFAFPQSDGTELPGIVRAINEQFVTIDFNHPLAGQQVRFAVKILEVNP